MITRAARLSALALLAMFLSCAADQEKLYIYRTLSPDLTGVEIRIQPSKNKISFGDLAAELNVCRNTEPNRCITSVFLTFAVPKGDFTVGDSWTVDEIVFVAESESMVGVLGQAIEMYWITATDNEGVAVFYFSKERGLVGIGSEGEGAPKILSVTYCGLFADSACIDTF